MAPSATSEFGTPMTAKQQPETHVHGAEDKTPLEAISQGPLIQPGEIKFLGLDILLWFYQLCKSSMLKAVAIVQSLLLQHAI
jgi:hypothetical protein